MFRPGEIAKLPCFSVRSDKDQTYYIQAGSPAIVLESPTPDVPKYHIAVIGSSTDEKSVILLINFDPRKIKSYTPIEIIRNRLEERNDLRSSIARLRSYFEQERQKRNSKDSK